MTGATTTHCQHYHHQCVKTAMTAAGAARDGLVSSRWYFFCQKFDHKGHISSIFLCVSRFGLQKIYILLIIVRNETTKQTLSKKLASIGYDSDSDNATNVVQLPTDCYKIHRLLQ